MELEESSHVTGFGGKKLPKMSIMIGHVFTRSNLVLLELNLIVFLVKMTPYIFVSHQRC